MANPRIEEVSDEEDEDTLAADPEEMSLDAFDFARPQKGSLQPASDPSASQMRPEDVSALLQPQNAGPQPQPQLSDKDRDRLAREQRERSKNYQCLYPVYFDKTRSREEGRRVKKEDAVANPLARDIVEAVQAVGQAVGVVFQVVFEPSKCHPKDWANPGRVRVLVKEGGVAFSPKVKSKHRLYKMVAEYLKAHPTTEESPYKLQLHGLPMPKDGKVPAPAIPKGFKIGTVLPLHSPALSGGGVSDNFLKDMMAEMGGQLPEGMQGIANMGAGGGGMAKPKKVRVNKK